MKKIYSTLFVAAVLLSVASCKKDDLTSTPQNVPNLGSMFMRFLRHNATDSIPTLPSGISVHLYSSLSDLNNRTNQIGATLTPDGLGQIAIPAPVEKKTYYWWAEIDNSCIYNVGSVNVASNLTYSSYAELTSPDTLFILNSDTCSTCKPYTVYMKPALDPLASKYVSIGDIKFIKPAYKTDTIPNLPIGVDYVRITRDSTLKAVGLITPPNINSANDDSVNYGLVFSVTNPFVLHSIDIYNGSKKGTITLELQDNTGAIITGIGLNPLPVTLNSVKGKNTVVLDWKIPAMNDMRLVRVIGGTTQDSLIFSPGALAGSIPIAANWNNYGQITSGINNGTITTDYNLAYNWQFLYHPAIDSTFTVNMNCNSGTTFQW